MCVNGLMIQGTYIEGVGGWMWREGERGWTLEDIQGLCRRVDTEKWAVPEQNLLREVSSS